MCYGGAEGDKGAPGKGGKGAGGKGLSDAVKGKG